jgi:hypothetical protein
MFWFVIDNYESEFGFVYEKHFKIKKKQTI